MADTGPKFDTKLASLKGYTDLLKRGSESKSKERKRGRIEVGVFGYVVDRS